MLAEVAGRAHGYWPNSYRLCVRRFLQSATVEHLEPGMTYAALFFHDVEGRRQRDTDGTDLPDIHAARSEAIAYAGQVLKDQPDKVWADGQWRVEVADEEGRLLFTLVTVAVDAPASEGSGSPEPFTSRQP